jgi:GNAT superfamily N-acetyltransferase
MYKNSPCYVPALVLDELDTLNAKKNPAFEYCEAKLFLAYRDGEIAGRIAAIINHRSNEIWKQKHARFGFIDFIDDNEVVDALFAAAGNWAKSKGMEAIHGPLGFTDLDREGLLIEGFDRVGTMATIYCYPYYREQLERAGFRKDVDWNEYYIPVPESVPDRHQRIAQIVREKYGLKVLKFKNLKQITPYISQIFTLLNKAYQPLYGYVPLTDRQIEYYVKMYVPLLCWDIVSIIVKKETDQVVAFGIACPSLSKALQKSRGKLLPFGWIHLLKALKGKGNPVVDLMIIGIDPEYQGKGVNAMIFADIIPSAHKCGFLFAESNPELETNNKVASLWDGFNAERHKVRRAYIKEL